MNVMIGRPVDGATRHCGRRICDGAGGRRRFLSRGGLERRFRDIQAARYHPLLSGPQAEYAGAMALGLPVEPDILKAVAKS